MENTSQLDREARILEIQRLLACGEYQIDPSRIAAKIIEEHMTLQRDSDADQSNAASIGS